MAEIYGEHKKFKELKSFKEFRIWWTNYYWFNYKYVIIVVTVILLIVGWFAYDILTKTKPDLRISLVTETMIPSEFTESSRLYLEENFYDTNDDGEVYVSLEPLGRKTEASDSYGVAAQSRFVVSLNEPELIMYLVDEHNKDYMIEMELVATLSELSLDFESEDSYSVDITHTEFTNRFSFEWEELGMKLYAVFKKCDRGDEVVRENLLWQADILGAIISEK